MDGNRKFDQLLGCDGLRRGCTLRGCSTLIEFALELLCAREGGLELGGCARRFFLEHPAGLFDLVETSLELHPGGLRALEGFEFSILDGKSCLLLENSSLELVNAGRCGDLREGTGRQFLGACRQLFVLCCQFSVLGRHLFVFDRQLRPQFLKAPLQLFILGCQLRAQLLGARRQSLLNARSLGLLAACIFLLEFDSELFRLGASALPSVGRLLQRLLEALDARGQHRNGRSL